MPDRSRVSGLSLKFVWTCCVRDDGMVQGSPHHVALTLATFMNKDGECKPSLAKIAESAGISKTTVVRALRTLIALGYLSVTRGGGRRHPSIYRALVPKRVDSLDPYVRDTDGRGFAKRVDFGGAKGRTSRPEGRSEGGRTVLEGKLGEGSGSSRDDERLIGLLRSIDPEPRVRESNGALVWRAAPLAGEVGVLADCEALVESALARWVA